MANPPVLTKPIPARIVNEGASFPPLNLNEFIQSPDPESGAVRFQAELANGNPLPKGLICTSEGAISGIPAAGTQGDYDIVILAENDAGVPFKADFKLTIKSRIVIETTQEMNELKNRVWEALGKDLPLPEIGELISRPVSAEEVYYLLERFATLTIWDVYNLDPPGEKHLLQLEGCSKHYNIYDRGSCLVASPKELFSHERTLADALQTAKVMAAEVHKRGWVIEFAGFDKMARAAWIQLQIIAEKTGKPIEILHYTPTQEDILIYSAQMGSEEVAPKI